jgi:hypothetical protein
MANKTTFTPEGWKQDGSLLDRPRRLDGGADARSERGGVRPIRQNRQGGCKRENGEP